MKCNRKKRGEKSTTIGSILKLFSSEKFVIVKMEDKSGKINTYTKSNREEIPDYIKDICLIDFDVYYSNILSETYLNIDVKSYYEDEYIKRRLT